MYSLIQKVYGDVVGRRSEILMIISALRAGKHIFLEGPPGTSKSTILQSISEHTETPYCLVTGNNDLTTSKLIGYFDPAETLVKGYKSDFFNSGPLLEAMQKGMYLYMEEFNRLPDETTNVFVTVMSERKLNVPRLGMITVHQNFRIIAALNPLDDIGISRISRALKDRFCSIRMDYQSRNEEIEIVKKKVTNYTDDMVKFAVDIAGETRKHPDLKLGASIRSSIDMVEILSEAKGMFPRGEKDYNFDELLLNSALMAFRSKIWVYETSERTPEDIIKEIFDKLHTPKKLEKKKTGELRKFHSVQEQQ